MRKPKQASSPSGLQAELCLPHLASHPTSSQTEDITVTAEKLPEKDKEDPPKKAVIFFTALQESN